MNRIDRRQQQHSAANRRNGAPAPWRVGNGSVSTEELQAWQLGPARIDHWLAMDPDGHRSERRT